MKFTKHYSITKGNLNLTPLIDVIFLQLIYFMLTSSFIMQPGIKITLPEAKTTETVEEQEVFVSVSKEGVIFFKDMPVTTEELESLLSEKASLHNNLILVVKGDKQSEHGIVVTVMDIARISGIDKIAIATMPDF